MPTDYYEAQARAARFAARRATNADVAKMLRRNAKAFTRMAANPELR